MWAIRLKRRSNCSTREPDRIRANNSPSETGLRRNSSAPISSAAIISAGVVLAVRKRI